MRWFFKRRRRPRTTTVTKHYVAHKAAARAVIVDRLAYWNQFYGYSWQRVAIRNQRRCWGSCSSNRNLNFNYKLLFLPPCLRDYVIVHELCHLGELNHSDRFWALVAQQLPDYRDRQHRLRQLERSHGIAAQTLETKVRAYCCGECEGFQPTEFGIVEKVSGEFPLDFLFYTDN